MPDRILTTHAGSLPSPDALVRMMWDRIDGKPVQLRNTSVAARAGIALVPDSRRSMLFSHEPVYKNISISILQRIGRILLRPAEEMLQPAAMLRAKGTLESTLTHELAHALVASQKGTLAAGT